MTVYSRRQWLWVLLAAFFVGGSPVHAQDEPPAPPSLSYYQRMMQTTEAIEDQGDILLWGRLSERVPERVLGLRLDYRSRRYDSAYRDDNRVGDVIQSMRPQDPFGSDGRFFQFITEVDGRLQMLDLRLSYGILDHVTFYAHFPLVKQEADLDFRFTPGTSARIGVRTVEDLFRLYEQYGRPAPDARFRSLGWDPGDLTTGFLWTYYEGRYFSATSQFSLIVPSGILADPNQAQRFGMGAQLDVGQGSLAPGLTHMMHVRLPGRLQWIGLWLEGSFFYYLEDEREGPKWSEPNAALAGLSGDLQLDDNRFLDLSKVDRSYTITPGAQVDTLAAVTFYLRYFTLGFGYFYDYRQEPIINADADLKRFFDAGESYLAGDGHSLALQVGVPLSWIRVPGLFNVGYAYPVGGRNSLRYEDRFDLQTVFFLPLF
ncbi:MAG: hypothetical protein P9L99_18120 [Candidatus Lernaella stagnicola]|nr:hypothetical protein [Candidatus Lernaella stagnicola]